ncbi:MAG: tyrosine-protein phosphatase, partial [Tannerellaceae bacterium]
QLGNVTEWDSMRLDNLKIKTIIDLRTLRESQMAPIRYMKANILQIPVSIGNIDDLNARFSEKRIRKGDAIVYMQDLYLQFLTANSEQYAKALAQFFNKDNYPILFNCSFGKDRSGFLAAMLLATLGVSEEEIMKDYLASNDYIKLDNLAYLADMFNTDGQEAITVLLSANESFLTPVLQKIKKDYGSIDKYLSKELHVTDKNRAQLKEIMLYR